MLSNTSKDLYDHAKNNPEKWTIQIYFDEPILIYYNTKTKNNILVSIGAMIKSDGCMEKIYIINCVNKNNGIIIAIDHVTVLLNGNSDFEDVKRIFNELCENAKNQLKEKGYL